MTNELFIGKKVQLRRSEPEEVSKAYALWDRDSEYRRYRHERAVWLWSQKKYEEWAKEDSDRQGEKQFSFDIHTLVDHRLIGYVELFLENVFQGDAWVGISLGEREYWGKGYGTDAMALILYYAFEELNLRRVSLGVLAYNPRAIRAYEKAGFVVEGAERRVANKDGVRYDAWLMGILREEWLARYMKERNQNGG